MPASRRAATDPTVDIGTTAGFEPTVDLAIVGPTASGKTALALAMADRVERAELVSVDSMAVYRGLDIGTETPHTTGNWHLVDIVDPGEDFSVARFQAAAAGVLSAIAKRGHLAVLVGGTGLYHRAVLDGLELPGRYPEVRAELEAEAATGGGVARLYERLAVADPQAASRIEPDNSRRVVRALEVVLGSGRRFSGFGKGLTDYPQNAARLAGLALDRGELDRRLGARLDAQLAAGWVDEVAGLARRGGLSRTARQAIGYDELLRHVAGSLSLEEAKASILRRLKSFARRQESWFRRDPRVVWFDATAAGLADAVLAWWSSPVAEVPAERETGPQ
ncbi:MAG: tRNA (adenosine(37)-N6)-dimethylallyltransferase MiaA [Acidimicrobiales bacterium]